MSRASVKKEVRKRDRFLCQYCGKRGEQFAHIVPDIDGGEYIPNNLVFLCYEHHQQLEAARTNSEMKQALVAIYKKLLDRPKKDDLLRYIFAWPAGKQIIVRLGGGITFVDSERIFECENDPDHPYLRLSRDKLGTLKINAFLEDSTGKHFMEIINNKLKVNTSDTLDIIINRRSITFEHKDTDTKLTIRQSKNMDLHITGLLHLNGVPVSITKEQLIDLEHHNSFADCRFLRSNHGLTIGRNTIAF
jgi:hypothetical protein